MIEGFLSCLFSSLQISPLACRFSPVIIISSVPGMKFPAQFAFLIEKQSRIPVFLKAGMNIGEWKGTNRGAGGERGGGCVNWSLRRHLME